MFKAKILPISCVALFFLIFSSTLYAGMSSTSYQIPTMVLSGGAGGGMSSANFELKSTLGQSSALGNLSSVSYSANTGFWYTLLLTVGIGDVNGDGSVDLEDVITALQVVTGQSPDRIFLEADANGDGRIGIVEAIIILNNLKSYQ